MSPLPVLVALAAEAFGADPDVACTLADPSPVVTSGMTFMVVNGRTYEVAGKENRLDFAAELEQCGAVEAGVHFQRWRACRRTTNWLLLTSPVVFAGLVVGGIPIPLNVAVGIGAAIDAGGQRRATEVALERELYEAHLRALARDEASDALPDDDTLREAFEEPAEREEVQDTAPLPPAPEGSVP